MEEAPHIEIIAVVSSPSTTPRTPPPYHPNFIMADMETISLVLMSLGCLVLSLCVILACLIIYQRCRNLKRLGAYSPIERMENGVIPISSTFSAKEAPDGGKKVEIVNEAEEQAEKENKVERVPSVKVRLF